MKAEKLLEYLGILCDLEKSKYEQEIIISNLRGKINSCTKERDYNTALIEGTYTENEPESAPKMEYKPSKFGILIMVVFAINWGLGLAGVAFATGVELLHSRLVGAALGLAGLLIGAGIPYAIWHSIVKYNREKADSPMLPESTDDADKELADYRHNRVETLNLYISRVKSELEVMLRTYRNTCNSLKKCYAVNIIPENYRCIVPVCQFYQYVKEKRTYTIEKDNGSFDVGAINLYNDECFKRLIISKLDEAVNKLNQINDEQKEFRRFMEDAHSQNQAMLAQIYSGIDKGNKTLSSIEYENKQQTKELKYIANVEYMKYHY